MKSTELFKTQLSRIEVFHSKESFKVLQAKALDNEMTWVNHIKNNSIHEEILVHRTIEVTSTKESVEEFANNLEGIVASIKPKNNKIIIDLTNGTTLSKNILSTSAYVLDIPNQYIIDVSILSNITNNRGFLESDILSRAYIEAPDSTYLDNIAYLSLSQIMRFRRIIEGHSVRYSEISDGSADIDFFKRNLQESIRLKLDADQRKDNTIYRIAASSISASAEDLLTYLLERFLSENDARMFGEKIGAIRAEVEKNAPDSFDIDFFRKFNDFVLYLRNSTTHKKGKFLTELERFKADLSVKMAFPYIEFYTDIVFGILSEQQYLEKPGKIDEIYESMPKDGEKMYYGLDGDNTGSVLEELFFVSKNEEHFRKISGAIKDSILLIKKEVIKKSGKKSVVFEAGDDLLFTGSFSHAELESFQGIYTTRTSGLTCSIGYGGSFQEVYLALKSAKSKPGKNSIVGIRFS